MDNSFFYQPPDIYQAKRILAIQPHYDDNDIGAGGTLAALSDRGAEIIYLTITDDLVGVVDPDLPDEKATEQLINEQRLSGAVIGVKEHYWLNFPDAEISDYMELRRQIIRHIRMLKPDLLFTCDPWLPYEAHRDHVQTGLAASEACILAEFKRLKIDPQIDATYQPHPFLGIVFYYTHTPNLIFDISATQKRKHDAIWQYRAQFTDESMAIVQYVLEGEERQSGGSIGVTFGEPLKVMAPHQLHVNMRAWQPSIP